LLDVAVLQRDLPLIGPFFKLQLPCTLQNIKTVYSYKRYSEFLFVFIELLLSSGDIIVARAGTHLVKERYLTLLDVELGRLVPRNFVEGVQRVGLGDDHGLSIDGWGFRG